MKITHKIQQVNGENILVRSTGATDVALVCPFSSPVAIPQPTQKSSIDIIGAKNEGYQIIPIPRYCSNLCPFFEESEDQVRLLCKNILIEL